VQFTRPLYTALRLAPTTGGAASSAIQAAGFATAPALTSQKDLNNCGRCGVTCHPVANSTSTCSGGHCRITCNGDFQIAMAFRVTDARWIPQQTSHIVAVAEWHVPMSPMPLPTAPAEIALSHASETLQIVMAIQAMDVRWICRRRYQVVAAAGCHVLMSPMPLPVALENSAVSHAI
jgi:hypothetical protein